MKPLRLAVVGFGRVGQACAEALQRTRDIALGAIVRRADSVGRSLPGTLGNVPVVSHIGQVSDVRGALICVPAHAVVDAARDCLQHRIAVVECATLHGDGLRSHKGTLHRLSLHHKTPVIVGAGWDPGVLSLFRGLFSLVLPGGSTDITHRTGASLHHTALARTVPGVKDALCAEWHTPEGKVQRYVYVQLEPNAEPDRIREAIRADPLFMGAETQVFPVDNLDSLEEAGRGVLLERRGGIGPFAHQRLLLEARFDASLLTAQIMVAAAHVLPSLKPGARTLLDIPLGEWCAATIEKGEPDWM